MPRKPRKPKQKHILNGELLSWEQLVQQDKLPYFDDHFFAGEPFRSEEELLRHWNFYKDRIIQKHIDDAGPGKRPLHFWRYELPDDSDIPHGPYRDLERLIRHRKIGLAELQAAIAKMQRSWETSLWGGRSYHFADIEPRLWLVDVVQRYQLHA